MTAPNGQHGYGWVTKALHWATVAALVAQFVVGWTLSGLPKLVGTCGAS